MNYAYILRCGDGSYYPGWTNDLKKRLERKEGRLDYRRDEILRKAREEAQTVLREAKEYADETIRSYNKLGKASGSAKEMERERTKLREKMNALQKANGIKADQKPKKQLQAKDLRIGDGVRVLSMNLRGTVSTLPDARGNLFVQMGILRSQVNLKDLEKLEDELPAYSKSSSAKASDRMPPSSRHQRVALRHRRRFPAP